METVFLFHKEDPNRIVRECALVPLSGAHNFLFTQVNWPSEVLPHVFSSELPIGEFLVLRLQTQ